MKHTPGPWKLDQRSGCVAVYPASEDHICLSGLSESAIHYSGKGARFNGSFWDMDETAKANAQLIAAAPELLEALEMALEWIDAVPQETPLPAMPGFDRDWANDVIAKATAKGK